MSKKWFTSDFHLFHNNIIQYCDRPFENIWDMHETIIQGMNGSVAPNDELFILGDVSFYGGEKVQNILSRINGQKHFIIGNHDAKNMKKWDGWASVNHYLEIKDNKKLICLMHYPIESWNKMAHGSIHLHGHRHGVKGQCDNLQSNYFREDIGIDPWNFKPVNLDMLIKKWVNDGKIV